MERGLGDPYCRFPSPQQFLCSPCNQFSLGGGLGQRPIQAERIRGHLQTLFMFPLSEALQRAQHATLCAPSRSERARLGTLRLA